MTSKPWLDPEFTGENRLVMHPLQHADRVPLDGKWCFQLLHGPDEEPSADWGEAEVPGCWTMQGTWDRPHYTNVVMPFPGDPPDVPEANPIGVYEREFTLDPRWLEGRRVVLHVGAAESVLIASVNGEYVGAGKDSHLASEFEVTGLVRPGANTIRLRVVKWSDASYIEDQDQWWHGGITRSVYLYATPRVHLADLWVDAGLADDAPSDVARHGSTGKLRLIADVAFDGAPIEAGWTLQARLGDSASLVADVPVHRAATGLRGDPANAVPQSRHRFEMVAQAVSVGVAESERAAWEALEARLRPSLDGRVAVRMDVPDVVAWSSERPHLYPLHVALRSPSGENVEEFDLRVGFRRVEIDGVRLLVNGEPVLIRGVNRHDFDQRTGRVISLESMRADVIAMKQFGFNALRTAHYPNDPALLDICDELGLYVVDEADIEAHAFIDSLCDDPRYLAAWVDRCSRMVRRDRNHACVIVWSLGNESGHGANHDAAAGWIRRFDPSRPLICEGAIRWDWFADQAVSDILAPMYPPISAIVAHARSGRQRQPLIMAEFQHAMGNSNGNLAEYWDAIESTPGLQGGFMWEWWDHGLLQELPDGTKRWAYGGDFGDVPNDGNFCLDGLVWPDRRPKPALFEHRQIAAPVVATADDRMLAAGRVELANRQSFVDVAWLRASWELAADGEIVAGGKLPLPEIAPGARATVAMPGWRMPPEDGRELWLTLRFRTATATAWAPEGFEVCWAQLQVAEARASAVVAAAAGASAAAAVQLDEQGLLVHDLLASPPRLCLWRAPTDNDRIGGVAARWLEWGVDRLERRLLAVRDEGGSRVVEAEELAAGGVAVRHDQRFTSLPGGSILVEETVTVPGDLPDLARVGIVMETVPGLERTEWFGLGPVETYPDRRRAAPVTRWTSTVSDEYVPYVRPQENGGHVDVRWLELTGEAGRGLRLTADRPCQASATHFRAEDLALASHDVELRPRQGTTVHLDAAHRGLGTASCGPDTLPQYIVGPGVYRWSWSIGPVKR